MGILVVYEHIYIHTERTIYYIYKRVKRVQAQTLFPIQTLSSPICAECGLQYRIHFSSLHII